MPKPVLTNSTPNFKTGIYEHYKGKRYVALFVACLEESLEPHVVYVPLYDMPDSPSQIWLRPLDDFTASMTVEGVIRPRFKYIGPAVK